MQSKEALNDLLRNSVFIDDKGKITITSWETDKTIDEQCEVIRKELDYAETMHTLEEQLGCPLEVFVKALTNGVYVIDEETKELQCILRGIHTFTGEGLGTSAGFSDERVWRKKVNRAGIEFCPIYFWKDYKKTWWLEKDRSE